MYDTLQLLNYRVMPGGGLGFHAIASKTTTLDLLGGLGYTRESYYDGTANNLLTATVGDEFTHKFTAEHFDYPEPVLPAVAERHQQLPRELQRRPRDQVESDWMTANVNFLDQYVNQPVPGNKYNDIIFHHWTWASPSEPRKVDCVSEKRGRVARLQRSNSFGDRAELRRRTLNDLAKHVPVFSLRAGDAKSVFLNDAIFHSAAGRISQGFDTLRRHPSKLAVANAPALDPRMAKSSASASVSPKKIRQADVVAFGRRDLFHGLGRHLRH